MTASSENRVRVPVKFERPPIYEVACGVIFGSDRPLSTAHVGAYWQRIQSGFPTVQDVAPLASVMEQPGMSTIPFFEFSNLPPLRRVWFLSEDERNLIQLQGDRFTFNWKRSADTDSYPSYAVVIQQFEKYLDDFVAFCSEIGLGTLGFRQLELAYVNQITNANGLTPNGLGDLLVDHMRSDRTDRFLPEPDGANWTTTYLLPNDTGRLHVVAQTAVNLPTSEKVARIDLTARGISPDTSPAGRRAWFDQAHEWITHGFVDLTNPVLHAEGCWKRTS